MDELDEDKIDAIFDRCEEIEISLNEDPIQMGPKYLNEMVAITRNYMNEVQKYEREIIRQKCALERILNKKTTEYEMRSNDLMSNNEEVRSQSSVSDRKAKVASILSDLNTEIKELESRLTDLGHAESYVSSKIRELRDVNRDIRLQKRLIEDEITVGAHWGDDNTKDFTAKHHEAKDILLDSDEEPEEEEEEEVSDEDLYPDGYDPNDSEDFDEMFDVGSDEDDFDEISDNLSRAVDQDPEEDDWADLDGVFG